MRPGQVRDGDVTPSGSRQYRFALFTASVRAIELNCPEYFGKDLVKLFRFGVKPGRPEARLRAGVSAIEDVLVRHGFKFVFRESGDSSGGPYTSGDFPAGTGD